MKNVKLEMYWVNCSLANNSKSEKVRCPGNGCKAMLKKVRMVFIEWVKLGNYWLVVQARFEFLMEVTTRKLLVLDSVKCHEKKCKALFQIGRVVLRWMNEVTELEK